MEKNTKHIRKGITAVLFAAIMIASVVLLLAPTTSAIVTTGLDPESGPDTCPAGYGLEDFESGTDGMHGGGPPIASTIPGVSFVTTAGQDWWTGDWATGQYNGKYPSGGAYTSGGQKWAWLGVSQGSGIIDFTLGEASYVSVYTSTKSGMVMDAYKDDGTFLASSGWATDNINTGKMTMLSISRPTADIGYVTVHDTGNYWLIDWLCTDAPGFSNQPPVADAGSYQPVEQTYYQGALVPLDGSGSSDPDGDPLTYSWTWTGGSATGVNPIVSLPLGTTTITLVVNDGTLDSAPDTVDITVQDTTPPEIACPADVTVEQESAAGTVVPLTATATDICDAAVEITSDELAIYPLGPTTVTFTATDASGNSASCTTTVTVEDTTPPVISVTVSPDTLWPPNHKMVDIAATVTVSDICDVDPSVVLTSITSDEPDNDQGKPYDPQDGTSGDGNTDDDIQGADIGTEDYEFQLRAERAGAGDGRVYTITYTVTDASGNSAIASATVVVPHDMD